MKLELVDEITVKTFDELEVHEKKVKDKIAELNPEYYYCGETKIHRLIWRTKIYILRRANKYTWKDIVKINDKFYAEEFEISGKMDTKDIYQIDDFINSVAKKYDVDPDDIETYMMDNIDFSSSVLKFGAEHCGCYINGVAEWMINADIKDKIQKWKYIYRSNDVCMIHLMSSEEANELSEKEKDELIKWAGEDGNNNDIH